MPLSDLVTSLLAKRGITSAEEVAAFLQPEYASLHDASLMTGMREATTRTLDALEKNERIAIYADFDCDGIPGAALLNDVFEKIGYANVETYLPHRDKEGYGFHERAIEELSGRGVRLIITVDVGTSAVSAVRFAEEKGIDVIVTDHHEITGELPDAIAVLNPKRAPYPFPSLCGTGVAFKFAQALIAHGKERNIPAFEAIRDGWEKWLLDLVAIATIADMVPLVGENRILAYWGLSVLRKSPRPGIRALCSELRIRQNELTEDDIGFSIAPRVNAASRMDSPMLALSLLATKDRSEAERLARELERLNRARKGVVAGIVKTAKKNVMRFAQEERVVVLGDPEWKPSLLGLAANSIVESRGGVVCLWGRDSEGRLKGSCRSDGTLSVVELFSSCAESFEEFGGHAASGGFTLVSERVHTLHETLSRAASQMPMVEREAAADHDALITVREVSRALYDDLSRLAPFGVGNKKPLFRITNASTVSLKRFGKEQNHLEVLVACPESGVTVRAFDFFRGPEDLTHPPAPGAPISLIASIERDSFRGGIALRLVDILPA